MCMTQWVLNIVESGYYTVKDCQNWADKMILNSETPDAWICDISLAKDSRCIRRILVNEELGNINVDWDVVLGYRYMMYRENRITLVELLYELLDEDNMIVEYCDLPYEKIWEMYKVIENKHLKYRQIQAIQRKLEQLLQPYFRKAAYQKAKLESDER